MNPSRNQVWEKWSARQLFVRHRYGHMQKLSPAANARVFDCVNAMAGVADPAKFCAEARQLEGHHEKLRELYRKEVQRTNELRAVIRAVTPIIRGHITKLGDNALPILRGALARLDEVGRRAS